MKEKGGNIESAYQSGVKLLRKKRYRDALDRLNEAAGLLRKVESGSSSITYFDIHMLRGECYQNLLMLQDAKEEYEQALQMNPYSADACYNLGLCFEMSGLVHAARRMYEYAVSLRPQWQLAREKCENCKAQTE